MEKIWHVHVNGNLWKIGFIGEANIKTAGVGLFLTSKCIFYVFNHKRIKPMQLIEQQNAFKIKKEIKMITVRLFSSWRKNPDLVDWIENMLLL